MVDNLIAGLVLFGVGDYRQVCEMDIENAVNTFCIFYINRINENLAYENAKKG